MKALIFSFVILSALNSLGQSTPLFENFYFDSTYQIIGVCPQLDEKQVYQKLSFIITNVDKMNLAKQNVTHGKMFEEPVIGDDGLEIYITKDKEVLKIYHVSPKYKYISYHPTDSTHGIFPFDIQSLYQLADSKPLSYSYKDFTFKNEKDFKIFLSSNKTKKNFLCYEDVSEELNGRFSVIIPKSTRIQKIRDGWSLIESELGRITSRKKDYLISFDLTESTDSTFYYQINTSKDIHQKFNLKDYPKSSWTANLFEISTVWLK